MMSEPAAITAKKGESGFMRLFWLLAARREYALALLLACIIAAVTARNSSFLAPQNLRDILVNCVQPVIISCGVMLVIVTGEIDISVGSAMGLLTALLGIMVSPTHLGWPVWAAVLLTLAIGTSIGLVNGLLVTLMRVPSIIVTLAMLMGLQSLTVMILKDGFITDLPSGLRFLGIGEVLGIRVSIWIAALVVAGTMLMVKYTPIGRRVFAVGSNPHGATLAGLSVVWVKVFAFAITGLLVGVATVVTQLATFDNGVGAGMELLVVTCVVVGGVSISGGTGTVIGVVLGVLLLSIQKTVLIFLNLGQGAANWDRAIQGALILAAVLVDHVASRRGRVRSGH